jgi:hypothetical protein
LLHICIVVFELGLLILILTGDPFLSIHQATQPSISPLGWSRLPIFAHLFVSRLQPLVTGCPGDRYPAGM